MSPSTPMQKATGFEDAVEQLTPIDLNIRGEFPPWLSGVLYRTGPGTYTVPSSADPTKTTEIQHWFDGLAMHHRFEIIPASSSAGPRVVYRSHKGAPDLERAIADAAEYPKELFSFAQRTREVDLCANIFEKFFTTFASPEEALAAMAKDSPPPDVRLSNVSVTISPEMPGVRATEGTGKSPKNVVIKTDLNSLQVVEPSTMKPVQFLTYADLDPRLTGQLCASHACRDIQTGDFYNFVEDISLKTTFKVFRIRGDNGKVDVLAEIQEEDAPPTYIHSITMTDRYVVMCIWQMHISQGGISIMLTHNVADALEKKWHPEKPSIFYVIDRHNGGVVAKYKTEAFHAFHHLNGYDEPGTGDVIIDISVYPNTEGINLLYLNELKNTERENKTWMGQVRRFRLSNPSKAAGTAKLPMLNAKVDFTLPESVGIELPNLAPGKHFHTYQYAYGMTRKPVGKGPILSDGIVKFDMHAAAAVAASGSALEGKEGAYAKLWRVPDVTPSEPVFAKRPGGTAEDDGVLLSVALDTSPSKGKGQSALVVIDAKTMKEVARAEMPVIFPFGFHGHYTPSGAKPWKNAM